MKNVLFTKSYKTTRLLLILLVLLFSLLFGVWLLLLLRDPSGSQRGILFIDDKDWFMDWFNTVFYAVGRTPYSWGVAEDRNYAPIVYLMLYPFTRLFPYDISGGMSGSDRYDARYEQLPIVGAVVFLIGCYLILFYTLYKTSLLKEHNKLIILTLLFLSGVSMNSIERMNIQILTSASLFAYIYLCDRDTLPSKAKTIIGLLCLAFSAALKLFPAIFGILLLYKKRWKEAAIAFISGILMVLSPFAWVDQPFTEAFTAYISGMAQHSSYMTISDFGFSTPMMLDLLGGASQQAMQIVAYVFLILSIAGSYFLKSRWKKIALLTLPLILTSGQQGYYCLMFLFMPVILFFNEKHGWIDLSYVVMFAAILSPLQRTAYINGVAISAKGVINLVLIILNIELVIEAFISMIHASHE